MDVWNLSMDLVVGVYELTVRFPKDEKYGLSQQMRRSAVSIPSNIAEGAARKSSLEFIQFLHIALGSLSELETQLIISEKLNYSALDLGKLQLDIDRIRRMLIGLIRYKKANG